MSITLSSSETARSRILTSGTDPDPRETMRRLPGPFQLPLTMLTGKAYAGQKQMSFTATTHLVTSLVSIVLGVAGSVALTTLWGWWLFGLLGSWAVTLHGMRNLRMMVYHQCAHRNMWKHKRADAFLGRVCASLLLVQNFDRYAKEHVSDHHAVGHMTLSDPTVQAFLVSLQLHPGMSSRAMWARVLRKLASPVFHARFAWSRLRSFAHRADRTEKLLATGFYGAVLAATAATGSWTALVLGWLVPLFPFFQVSNTLRLCVKHTFPSRDQEPGTTKEYFGGLTNAIFLGEPVPARGAGAIAWLRWGARTAFVHFPARYLVMTGDTVCHDFHHRRPSSGDWANYIFARQRDVEAGHPGWPAYREVWGLTAAIDTVFRSLAEADPKAYDVARLQEVSSRELFAAFDD